MPFTEILGFITGAACVWLAARGHIWNWPIGIANNVFFLVLFWHAKLYADAGLQIVYMGIAVYGWWNWLHGGQQHTAARVQRLSAGLAIVLLPMTVGSAATLYWILRRFTDSNVPLGDAVTTALSLTAQFMLGRKLVENWLLWIVADVIYIGLYTYKNLYLTAVLYVAFIVMCVAGYRHWSREFEPVQELDEVTAL